MLKITLMDRSLYYKGLLLLIRKDAMVTDPEMQLMRRIGRTLGFEAGFCENAIAEILDNPHIVDTPPLFSSPETARRFLLDGITIGHCDHEIHPAESEWLEAVARENGLDYEAVLAEWRSGPGDPSMIRLEAESLTI